MHGNPEGVHGNPRGVHMYHDSIIITPTVNEFDRWVISDDFYANTSTIDEYEVYISEPVTSVEDLINWWRDHRAIYLKFSQITFNLLSIPVISAECERVFS